MGAHPKSHGLQEEYEVLQVIHIEKLDALESTRHRHSLQQPVDRRSKQLPTRTPACKQQGTAGKAVTMQQTSFTTAPGLSGDVFSVDYITEAFAASSGAWQLNKKRLYDAASFPALP